MHVTQCECKQPGWCDRHQCEKTLYWFEMCRRREDFFQAWERGRQLVPSQAAYNASLQPCIHRGVSAVGEVECDLCGLRKVMVAVFECVLFTECTERRYGTRTERSRAMRACMGCDEYRAGVVPSIPGSQSEA